uniref:Uncharacterized protein n=1 Tax=Strongyloides stercoralis TaxID=6248 RepID=A0AAF5DSY3_STRER
MSLNEFLLTLMKKRRIYGIGLMLWKEFSELIYAKLATKIVQFKVSEESYDQLKKGLLLKFREPLSSKKLIQSISQLNFDINQKGIKKLSDLILPGYLNADEETCIARLCDEMNRKVQDKIDAFVITHVRTCAKFNDAVETPEILEKTFKGNNNVKRYRKLRTERFTMGKIEEPNV